MREKLQIKHFVALFFCFVFLQNVYGQEKLLSMKIIYTVPIMSAEIKSSNEKDSIKYDYIVDKRFWWQTFDKVMTNQTLSYDTILSRFNKSLNEHFKREFLIEEVKGLIENNVRKVQFEERWWYDTKTMLIRSEVVAFQPIITIDSIVFKDEDFEIEEYFSYPLGWFKGNKESKKTDKVIITSNIEFTMPIYNPIPYQWYMNHLEAEYSIPFLDMLISKAENLKVNTFETPSSSIAFNKIEIMKCLEHQELESIVVEDSLSNVFEKDTVIRVKYTSEEVDYFRFGQKWMFDLETLTFTKTINYFAPVIRLTASDNSFRGFYPLFYIRKD